MTGHYNSIISLTYQHNQQTMKGGTGNSPVLDKFNSEEYTFQNSITNINIKMHK